MQTLGTKKSYNQYYLQAAKKVTASLLRLCSSAHSLFEIMRVKSMFNSLWMSFYSPTRLLNIYSVTAHKDLVQNWSKVSVVYWYWAWVCCTHAQWVSDAVSTAHYSDSDWSFFPPSKLDIILITTTILQCSSIHGAYLNVNIYTGCSCKVHLFSFTWFKL